MNVSNTYHSVVRHIVRTHDVQVEPAHDRDVRTTVGGEANGRHLGSWIRVLAEKLASKLQTRKKRAKGKDVISRRDKKRKGHLQ
jgi:hypothetical protein